MTVEEFNQRADELSAALISEDIDKAVALDEELVLAVGKDSRVRLSYSSIPPRLLVYYSCNRMLLRLKQGRVEEAAFCMNDVAEVLFHSGFHEDVYFLLNYLAENRGGHDIFSGPYEVACDYLMMAVLCQNSFMAMSLSFYWKARIIFSRLGHADIAQFIGNLIKAQSFLVSIRYKQVDEEGSILFEHYSGRLKGIKIEVPDPQADRKLEWPQNRFSDNNSLTPEERGKIFGPLKPHHKTMEEDMMLSKHWERFNYKESLLERADLSGRTNSRLPNLLEVMEMICYEEEKYALRCKNNGIADSILGDAHDWDANLDRVVEDDGRYRFFPKGIINDVYYRGQAAYYEDCKPSLYRGKSRRDVFIERVKLCEFSILIHKHPSSKVFTEGCGGQLNDGSYESHEIFIDEEALSQHYGILTEYMDLTADKWVAAFFACTDYKRGIKGERDTYEQHASSGTGIFYIYNDKKKKKYSGELRPVGLQPFSRPVLQAGYVMKMSGRQNFNTLSHGVRFRHDDRCTSIVYWLFNKAMKIQPEEVIEAKAKRIVEEKRCFSRDAFALAHKKFYLSLNDREYARMIKRYGLQMQDEPLVDFTSAELEMAQQEFGLQNWKLIRNVIGQEMMQVKIE